MKKTKSLEDELVELCHACHPDLSAIRRKIAEGADINAMVSSGTVLSDAICGFGKLCDEGDCSLLPELVKTFLDAGYDVSLDDGCHGGLALYELTNCYPGKEILEAAQLLLDAGANPDVCPYDDEPEDTVIDLVWHESDYQALEGDTARMQLYDQLLELLKSKSKKKWD